MQVKLLELRDEGTLIPLLCVDMNPAGTIGEGYMAQRNLLSRSGYPCDGRPNIAITHLAASGDACSNDPYFWNGRTRPVAHDFIIKNWAMLKDGDVVDVQFILGETTAPKVSEVQPARGA
jgi:hypothetical protein